MGITVNSRYLNKLTVWLRPVAVFLFEKKNASRMLFMIAGREIELIYEG